MYIFISRACFFLNSLASSQKLFFWSLTLSLSSKAAIITSIADISVLPFAFRLVMMKSLFEPLDNVEGYIRVGERVYQFNSRAELDILLGNCKSKDK